MEGGEEWREGREEGGEWRKDERGRREVERERKRGREGRRGVIHTYLEVDILASGCLLSRKQLSMESDVSIAPLLSTLVKAFN